MKTTKIGALLAASALFAVACGTSGQGGGTAPATTTDSGASSGGDTAAADSSTAKSDAGAGQGDTAVLGDGTGASSGGDAHSGSNSDAGSAAVDAGPVAIDSGSGAVDAGTKPGCASAKVVLKGSGAISSKNLDFPDICKKASSHLALKLSYKAGTFEFDWEPLTSEPPNIHVLAKGIQPGKPMPLSDKNIKIVVPKPAPFGNCSTAGGSNKPADIGTATLTAASDKPGTPYVFKAAGKAYCYSGSSGGSSWDGFELTIEGKL